MQRRRDEVSSGGGLYISSVSTSPARVKARAHPVPALRVYKHAHARVIRSLLQHKLFAKLDERQAACRRRDQYGSLTRVARCAP